MNSLNNLSGEFLNNLPSDQTEPSVHEITIIDTLFKEKQTTLNKFLFQTQDILIMGILFVLISLPQIDSFVGKLVPIASKSVYTMIGIKAIVFMTIFFVIKNLYLVRK